MKIIILFAALILNINLFAQSPQSFNYQAIIKNNTGTVVANKLISAKISILANNINGNIIFTETHSINTDNAGLINLNIGMGNISLGSIANINWSNNLYFIKIEIDPDGGNNYQLSGVSQLLSVPYALFAQKAGNINNSDTSTTNELQTLSIYENNLSISSGNTVTLPIVTYIAGSGINISGNTVSSTITGNATHTGDANGSTSLTVTAIQGKSISTNNPTSGQVLKWNSIGNVWEPATDLNTSYTAGTGISISGSTINNTFTSNATHSGDVTGSTDLTVIKIQGKDISTTAPLDNQFLKWNAISNKWEPSTISQNQWTSSGNNIYTNNSGNVGIGTSNPKSKFEVKGGNALDTLFQVKDVNGNPVFVVFPEGVRIFIKDGAKGNLGGFAVSGRSASKANTYDDVLVITPDSTTIYVNQSAKGNLGGFAVSGRSASKGTTRSFLNLTKQNYFIGHESGLKVKAGIYNSFLGYQAGFSDTLGSYNIFIGYQSGYSNMNGNNNIFVGYKAGYNNCNYFTFGGVGSNNVFIGHESGLNNISGFNNTFLGYQSGYSNTTANGCVAVGESAGFANQTGSGNTMIGYGAGKENKFNGNTFVGYNAGGLNVSGKNNCMYGESAGFNAFSGDSNVYIGSEAGFSSIGNSNVTIGYEAGRGVNNNAYYGNTFLGANSGYKTSTGSNNVFIGRQAGFNNVTGTKNIFIGYRAGYSETGSNKLYIHNSTGGSTTALIYGEFDSQKLRINASVGIDIAPDLNYSLTTAGLIKVVSTIYTSDKKYKSNINTLNNSLQRIIKMRGVSYNWKINEYPEMKFENTIQFGLIAQELETIEPSLVKTDANGNKAINYTQIIPILIESIKEQQSIINKQNTSIDDLNKKIDLLINEIENIKSTK